MRAPGSLSFQLDGGDASQVEAAVEATLVPRHGGWGGLAEVSWFAGSGAMSDFTRSVVGASGSRQLGWLRPRRRL